MRVLVTGGGTGGHVYPALAVIETLRRDPRWGVGANDVAWVGSAHSVEERILAREELAFLAISAGALRGAHPLQALRSLGALGRGLGEARQVLSRFRPDVVLATGGYVSVPLVLAARAAGRPVMIYLPDMEPGLAVRFLAYWAQRVAVSFDSVAAYFPRSKVIVSGYPVRATLYQTTRDTARQTLGLLPAWPTLLVFGGSRGAHAINVALIASLPSLLQAAQVVHISGPEEYQRLADLRNGLPQELQARYHLYAYMYEHMTAALAAADLVVARAGAATLGEFPAVGLPSILVPYPYAGQHQHMNAAYLAERGAGLILQDADLPTQLWPTIQRLLGDKARLQAMSVAARALAVPDAAQRIAAALSGLALKRAQG
jgi:UDP-N-acetylglucosamine--N-acetylmuramyl-(pentapeptide) pyrophosphoryl-undecaprenol N-acetylglucosamine transferase